jgi:hypothetical protein
MFFRWTSKTDSRARMAENYDCAPVTHIQQMRVSIVVAPTKSATNKQQTTLLVAAMQGR